MTSSSVLIGNSDNKLTQKEWAEYWIEVDNLVLECSLRIHFIGLSLPNCRYQNACWVFEVNNFSNHLVESLKKIREKYKQDSVALISGGITEFI